MHAILFGFYLKSMYWDLAFRFYLRFAHHCPPSGLSQFSTVSRHEFRLARATGPTLLGCVRMTRDKFNIEQLQFSHTRNTKTSVIQLQGSVTVLLNSMLMSSS